MARFTVWTDELGRRAKGANSLRIKSKVFDLSSARGPGNYEVWQSGEGLFIHNAPTPNAGGVYISVDAGAGMTTLDNAFYLAPGGSRNVPFGKVVIANDAMPGRSATLEISTEVDLTAQVDSELVAANNLSVIDINDLSRQAWGDNSTLEELERVAIMANLSAEKMADVWQKQLAWNVKNNIAPKGAFYSPGTVNLVDNTGGIKRQLLRGIYADGFPDLNIGNVPVLYRSKVNVVSTGGVADDAFYATDAVISPVSSNANIGTAPSIFAEKYAYSGPGFERSGISSATSYFSAQFRPVIIPRITVIDSYLHHRFFAEVHFPRANQSEQLRLDFSVSFEYMELQGITI